MSDLRPASQQEPASSGQGLFRRMFFEEGRGMLEDIARTVALLESSYDAGEVNTAFRAAHSLKSESSFLRYDELRVTAHALEDMLARLRSSGVRPGAETQKQLRAAYTSLSETFELIRSGKRATVPEIVLAGPDQPYASGQTSDERPAPRKPIDPEGALKLSPLELRVARDATLRGEKIYLLQCELGAAEPMIYARLYLVLSNLERRVNVIKAYPPLVEDAEQPERFDILYSTAASHQVGPSLADVDNVEFVSCREIALETLRGKAVPEFGQDNSRFGLYAEAEEVTVRLTTRSYERLCLYADEVQHELIALKDELKGTAALPESAGQRVSAALRMAARVSAAVEGSSELQLHEVFNELASRVRTAAQEFGKQLRFRSFGGDCRVFLPIGSVLNEALGHLVRNSADHGIESAEQRRSVGKPAEGLITVEARYLPEYLVVEVSDDGAGIDEAAMRAHEGSEVLSRSLLEIITQPGFSTRDSGGEHSGRGVGLDVVRHLIEQVLGGRLELENAQGGGLTFRLLLPRSTKLMSVIIVRFDGKEFAIPASEVYGRFSIDRRFLSSEGKGDTYYRHDGEYLRVFTIVSAQEALVSGATPLQGLLVHVGEKDSIIVVHEALAEETVVRDAVHPHSVYSQTLRTMVPLFLPLRFDAFCR